MQADHAKDKYILIWTRICLSSFNTKAKLGHKTQQIYNSLKLKIVLQICIHTQTEYFLIFKTK